MVKIEEIVLVVGQEASTSTSSSTATTTTNTSIAVDTITIEKPEILIPADGQTDFNGTIKSSEYKTSEYFYGEHQATDWEVSTDPSFSTVDISSYNDTVNLTSFPLADVKALTTYYVRVRYKSDNHISEWSEPVNFVTSNTFIRTPEITIQGEPNNVPEIPIISCSEFTVVGGEDTHQSTDWVIKDINGNIIWSSLRDTANLTSIRVPNNILRSSTTYIFEVTYHGLEYNSAAGCKIVTTADIFGSIFDIFEDGSSIALFELNGNANDTGGVYNGEEVNVEYNGGVLGLAADYRYKGTNSYIKTPVIDRGGSKEITFSCWLNVDRNISQWVDVFRIDPSDSYSNNGESRQPAFYIYRYDNTRFYVRNDGVNSADLGFTSNGRIEYGKWAHIVLIITLRQMRLYINKTLTDTYNSNQEFKFNNGVFYIGNPWYNKNFMIDQVRIFNRALTDEEIEILYNEGV